MSEKEHLSVVICGHVDSGKIYNHWSVIIRTWRYS